MKKIFVVYDTPFKGNDKEWLGRCLKSNAETYRICEIQSPATLSRLARKGILGRLMVQFFIICQLLRVLICSGKEDIVLCWTVSCSKVAVKLFRGPFKRKIVSFGWLTPNHKNISGYKNVFRRDNVISVVNDENNIQKYADLCGLENTNRIVCIPDTYNDREQFEQPSFNDENRYVFCGGMNNRDWETYIKVAELCPEISFKGISLKSSWDNSLKLPSNVKMDFDTKVDFYYSCMKNAYITLFPLNEDKVSGLINIVKTIQYGVLGFITEINSTKVYFPEGFENFLLPFHDSDVIAQRIIDAFNYSKDEYTGKVEVLQQFLTDNISPDATVKRLLAFLYEREWLKA